MRIVALLGISSVVHGAALLAYGYLYPSEPVIWSNDGQRALQLVVAPASQPVPLTTTEAAFLPKKSASQVVVTTSERASFGVTTSLKPDPVAQPLSPEPLQLIEPPQPIKPQPVAMPAQQQAQPRADSSKTLQPRPSPVPTPVRPKLKPMVAEPLMLASLNSVPVIPDGSISNTVQTGGQSAAVVTAAATSDRHSDQQRSELQRQTGEQLLQALENHFRYPLKARRKGWQGEVLLAVQLSEHGAVEDVQLAQSSGFDTLDRAALASMRKIDGIEGLERLAVSTALRVEVPVSYRLVN